MTYDHSLVKEIENFISLCTQYSDLYIYGATENQELLARYLGICGITVKGFLTSKPDTKR